MDPARPFQLLKLPNGVLYSIFELSQTNELRLVCKELSGFWGGPAKVQITAEMPISKMKILQRFAKRVRLEVPLTLAIPFVCKLNDSGGRWKSLTLDVRGGPFAIDLSKMHATYLGMLFSEREAAKLDLLCSARSLMIKNAVVDSLRTQTTCTLNLQRCSVVLRNLPLGSISYLYLENCYFSSLASIGIASSLKILRIVNTSHNFDGDFSEVPSSLKELVLRNVAIDKWPGNLSLNLLQVERCSSLLTEGELSLSGQAKCVVLDHCDLYRLSHEMLANILVLHTTFWTYRLVQLPSITTLALHDVKQTLMCLHYQCPFLESLQLRDCRTSHIYGPECLQELRVSNNNNLIMCSILLHKFCVGDQVTDSRFTGTVCTVHENRISVRDERGSTYWFDSLKIHSWTPLSCSSRSSLRTLDASSTRLSNRHLLCLHNLESVHLKGSSYGTLRLNIGSLREVEYTGPRNRSPSMLGELGPQVQQQMTFV
jgi:hypothetical protein